MLYSASLWDAREHIVLVAPKRLGRPVLYHSDCLRTRILVHDPTRRNRPLNNLRGIGPYLLRSAIDL